MAAVDPLTARQRLFVQAYLKSPNAKQAAIAAGYSANSAESQGSRLLSNAKVREALAEKQGEVAEEVSIEAKGILRELQRIALADVGDLFDEHGALKPIHQIPLAARRAIISIETEEMFDGRGEERVVIGHLKKVKLAPKNEALNLLGKHLKLFIDRVEHTGAVSVAVVDPYAQEKK